MSIKFGSRNLLRWAMVCLCIGGGTAHGEESPTQHLMDKSGVLIWDMMEIQTDFEHKRSDRGMTTERVQKYARDVAKQLTQSRNELAQLHKKFPPKDPFAIDLGKFLAHWPDENSFYDSLFAESPTYSDNLGGQLYGLGSQTHDTRRKWKTPFPIFRP